jgi:integrase
VAESTAKTERRRSPGEGSVYETKDRRGWRGALTWTAEDGTRHRRVVSGDTSKLVRDKLDDLRRELKLGTIALPGGGMTVGDYLADWIEREKAHVRPSTWKGRETHVRCYLVPALGKRMLSRLAPADVERALAQFTTTGRVVRRGRKPTLADEDRRTRQPLKVAVARPVSTLTARHIRATLRIALAAAVREGRLGRNAAADARPPYVPHRAVDYLDAPDVRRLIDATRDSANGPIYALAASTGLRLGELLGLAWSDVDDAGSLTVRHSLALAADGGWILAEPKSARSRRTIPLPGIARDALARRRASQEADRKAAGDAWQDRDGLVFTDTIGRPMRPEGVSATFQKARAAAGVPRVRFHDLRHSAATLMLAEGVPLAVISEWLGHAGIAITAAHYAAVVPTLRREAADAMDRALNGGAP